MAYYSAKMQAYRDLHLDDWMKRRPKPTVAGPQPEKPEKKRKLPKGAAQQALINKVMNQLRDWRESPFENEGACLAGLREGLCLDGHGWTASDKVARHTVGEALRRMGAVRPSWEQGQIEYTIPRENCAWCYSPIPDHFDVGRKLIRFCSDVCAKAAYEHRSAEITRKVSLMHKAAMETIQRAKNGIRPCKECGKHFAPAEPQIVYCSHECATPRINLDRECTHCGTIFRPGYAGQKLCSWECRGKAKITVAERMCLHCATIFRPKNGNTEGTGYYCSRTCAVAGRSTMAIEKTCTWCERQYIARGGKSLFCSKQCSGQASTLRRGRFRVLTAPAFDYVMRMAA